MWPPGSRLLLAWCNRDAPDDKVSQPLAAVMASGSEGLVLLFEQDRGGRRTAPQLHEGRRHKMGLHRGLEPLKGSVVAPAARHRPPMSFKGGPGDTLEVAMDLKLDQVRCAARNLGRCAGMEYWVGTPAPETLTTSKVWMNLLAGSRASIADLWTKLQVAPWFAGLRTGDRPGRVGVTVWGPAPVCEEIRQKLALELGAEVQQPKTLLHVYGYGPSFGLNACEEDAYAQQEISRVWRGLDVKQVECQHLTCSGIHRPIFSLTLEGVPMEQEQSILRETNARL